jgi:hypothetical protein
LAWKRLPIGSGSHPRDAARFRQTSVAATIVVADETLWIVAVFVSVSTTSVTSFAFSPKVAPPRRAIRPGYVERLHPHAQRACRAALRESGRRHPGGHPEAGVNPKPPDPPPRRAGGGPLKSGVPDLSTIECPTRYSRVGRRVGGGGCRPTVVRR